MSGTAWTKKEDTLLRRLYSTIGEKCFSKFPGRSLAAVNHRARRLGISSGQPMKFSRRYNIQSYLVTPELINWSNRQAEAFSKKFGDDGDRYGVVVSVALLYALRTYREKPDHPSFEVYAKGIVVRRLKAARASDGPVIYPIQSFDQPASAAGPVGWEFDSEDYVSWASSTLSEPHSTVIRLTYLDCGASSAENLAAILGWPVLKVQRIHDEAIAELRSRWRVERMA